MKLESKTIRFRLVEENDAEFILMLRMDGTYNKFLSEVSPDIEAQKNWIKKYKKEESEGHQYYFIIERLSDFKPCGTVRVYDLREDSFCWGSWILNKDKTRYSAIESALLVYEFGFDILGYSKAHFDVMKANEKVVSFHEKMGAVKTSEDELNYYFEMPLTSIVEAKNSFMGKFI